MGLKRGVILALGIVVIGTGMAGAVEGRTFRVRDELPEEGKRITPYLRYQLDMAWEQDGRRAEVFESLESEMSVFEHQRSLRKRLLENIGGLPDERTELHPKITGRIDGEGYTIEKLIFETQPGFYVTALVYVPDGTGPFPGALVACGHSPVGKASRSYQEISARLASRGYLTICWDPVGQGERSQFWDSAEGESRYNRVCGEHAVCGNVAYLTGANLARWEVWDGMRALDYLLSRSDVDGTRIIATGTSGGGFQTSYLMALDERITGAVSSCYLSSLPMRMANRIFMDPDSDPEQDVFRMVSSGVGHPGLALMMYPRPLGIAMAVEDFFPIQGARKTFREVAAIYRRFGYGDRIMSTEGYHPHSFSAYNQANAFAFLDRFHDIPVQEGFPELTLYSEEELRCTRSGQVHLDFPRSRTLLESIGEYYQDREPRVSKALKAYYRENYYPGIENWSVEGAAYSGEIASPGKVAYSVLGSERHEGNLVERIELGHSGYLSIPLLRITPEKGSGNRTIIWLGYRGKVDVSTWDSIDPWLEKGYTVYSFDFRGQGENALKYMVSSIDDPSLVIEYDQQYYNGISGVMANYIYNSLVTGRPYFLQMIEDVEIVQQFIAVNSGRGETSIAGGRVYDFLAQASAEVLNGLNYEQSSSSESFSWRSVVLEEKERWPIEFLLPYGAYIK